MAPKTWKIVSLALTCVLALSFVWFVLSYTGTDPVFMAGSQVKAYSYSVWMQGSTFYSTNGLSGEVEYTGSNFTDIVQSTITELTDGGTISFGLGNFTVPQTILYDENINFIGQSQTDDIGGVGTTLFRNGDFPIFNTTLEDIRHVSFKNMRLQGQGKGVGSTALVQLGDDTGDVLFESVTFADSGGDGIEMLGGSYWVTLINCQGQFLTGALVKKASPNTGTTFIMTNSIAHWGGPLVDLYGMKGISIQGGGGDHWDSYAVKLQLCVGKVSGLDLEGNASNTEGHGIWLISGGLHISGNRIYRFGNGSTYHPIYLTGGSSRSVISGNFIETTSGTYSLVFSGDAQGYLVEGNYIDKTVSGYSGKTDCKMEFNPGYQTVCTGTGEASHGDYIAFPYALASTPNVILVTVEENDARYILQAYELNTTHFRVYLWDDIAGASEAVDKTINFYAEYKP